MIREPAVAGQFYPESENTLLKTVKALLSTRPEVLENAIGALSPHAGYIYSGSVAGRVFASIKPKSTYIILGPNHTGLGSPFSISSAGAWKTPLGQIGIAFDVVQKIKNICPLIREDDSAHIYEHSIEVQLPFLQALQKEFKIVPIVISHTKPDLYIETGSALAQAVKDMRIEDDVMIIASSDMTHYESQSSAAEKDHIAIKAILDMDCEKLIHDIQKFDITMCGYAPAAVMLQAAKILGAKKSRLIMYQTSGDISGDYASVVGYAGIIIS